MLEYNVDLPAQLPMQSDGNFLIQPLPESWKESLLEKIPVVADLLESSNTYLAGGFLRQLVSEEPLDPEITDVDLFFNSDYTYQAVKTHFEQLDGMTKIFQCPEDKLATFQDSAGWKYQCIAVAFYPSLYSVVDSFDFTTTCFGTNGYEFICHKSAPYDTLYKNLRWNKITHPASSLRRMMKYARKGFTMSETELRYFVECVSNHSPDIVDWEMVYVD